MATRTGLSFRPKACLRCGGDAYLSRGGDTEWVCLQCGRVVPEQAEIVRFEPAAQRETEMVEARTGGREAA